MTDVELQERHRRARVSAGRDPSHWAEVLGHEDGGVTLCLSPELAKMWSENLATNLGARAVSISPAIVEMIKVST